jgi:hypothetical protein
VVSHAQFEKIHAFLDGGWVSLPSIVVVSRGEATVVECAVG